MNVSCSFQNRICLEGPNAAFQIKNEWIDTNNDLRINFKPSNRLKYRKITTCSVLRTTDYINSTNTTGHFGDALTKEDFNYGPAGGHNSTFQYYVEESRTITDYVLR